MAYSLRARELRHCTALRKDGELCRGWAMWGGRFCWAHADHLHTGVKLDHHAHYPPCSCAAYAWPHRPGGGLCRWPDAPAARSSIPAGRRGFYTRIGRRHNR